MALCRACAAVAALAIGTLTAGHFAFSQQKNTATVDLAARSQEILAHLSAVLRFYRSTTAPVQKIGEPNDVVYRDQAVELSTQAAGFALQSAKAEAALMAAYKKHEGISQAQTGPEEQQRLQNAQSRIEAHLSDLKTQEEQLDRKIAAARPRDLSGLQTQRKQVEGSIDLAKAMQDAIGRIVSMSDTEGSKGLAADIDSMQRSVPELGSKAAPVAPQLAPLGSARSSGITSQTMALFDLLGSEHTIDSLIHDNDRLHQQALELRQPISKILHNLIAQSGLLSQPGTEASAVAAPQTAGPAAAPAASTATSGTAAASGNAAVPGASAPSDGTQNFQSITTAFRALSSASVPLSQEIIVLEQSEANLQAWKAAVDREYKSIFDALLLRLLVIAIALAVIFGAGEIWTRATNKYVRDLRRRRQILFLRRAVVGLLSAIVLLFGFVTQFNSLATFAGFLTAGIAVGLQTILLSVAAYFFIIGRYGIKVGDRITIAAVTGDVIDVGLVRFYLMELAGNGPELNPTGRVAVFSNAVLFQAGSPLYKQIPGTEHAWHELIVKLAEKADYRQATDAILKTVQTVYEGYRTGIEKQHRDVELWIHTSVAAPAIESRLQFESDGLQMWVRFPVQISHAAETDEHLTKALIDLFAGNAQVREAVLSMPVIRPAVKG
ncbi:mechanosensitive ion channel family protein [Paracidobacterium acidisoli]|nr:mechanosensitive ion channel family protein [Paracidobacterium acidisoli]